VQGFFGSSRYQLQITDLWDFWIASDAKSTPTGILVKTYHSVSKILLTSIVITKDLLTTQRFFIEIS